jgi:hypothetical protein
MPPTTCGPIYAEELSYYTGGDDALVRVYAAGFVHGQAEKVYLGACRAAMFRPSEKWRSMMDAVVHDAARRYGLLVIPKVGSQSEFWICRAKYERDVIRMAASEEDSAAWHKRRAWLCGVPDSEVDVEFHLREGAKEVCD